MDLFLMLMICSGVVLKMWPGLVVLTRSVTARMAVVRMLGWTILESPDPSWGSEMASRAVTKVAAVVGFGDLILVAGQLDNATVFFPGAKD